MRTISQDDYMKAGQIFHWAFADHYKLWFTGKLDRHRRTETMLPRLVRKGLLVEAYFGKRKVYAVKRLQGTLIGHGLGVTETIVRIHKKGDDGVYLPERIFKGQSSVPDWGLKKNGNLLLVEYSTQNNFEAARIIKTKMSSYRKNLPKIVATFGVDNAYVLFVLDVSLERVQNFIAKNRFQDPYFFVDFETFKSVPFEDQLSNEIYLWGDGSKGHITI